jgi:Rod binding domain-containing protein
MVYVDRYPVAARYFESIFTDMIFMPMRYDNAIDPGRI